MDKIEQLSNLKTKLHKRKNTNIIPGQTYQLPSLGKYYENGVLSEDTKKGEIVIFPMTTLDEISLKSPDMLLQGTAISEVIQRRVPQILNPLKLFPKDVDYILTALRQITYGDVLDISYECTKCQHKEKTTTKLSYFLSKSKSLDNFDESKLSFEIDNFGFKIKFSSYEEMVSINQKHMNNSLSTSGEIYSMFLDNLTTNIVSIDDIEDKDVIREFLTDADVIFQRKILKHIQDINAWGMEFFQSFSCSKCSHVNEISIDLNPVTFFSLPLDQVIPNESHE